MRNLELTLFGNPQIKVDGEPFSGLKSQKAQALFYFLATTGQPHSRQRIAELLWTALSEERARTNLRVELAKFPKILKTFLIIERSTLAFNQAMRQGLNVPHALNGSHEIQYISDISRFEAMLKVQQPTAQQMKSAVDLYHGEFLEDFHVQDAPSFEQWRLNQQTRFNEAVLQMLFKLSRHYTEKGEYSEGLHCTGRLLHLEPWREEGHRQMMQLLALNGQRGAALAQYDSCCQFLHNELGVQPSTETDALYDQIERGELRRAGEPRQAVVVTNPTKSSSEGYLPAHREPMISAFQAPSPPLHFVGRHSEMERIEKQLTTKSVIENAQNYTEQTSCSTSNIYAIVGMCGIGKTTLAIQIAHHLQERFSDGILWANAATSESLNILDSWARAYSYDFSSLSDMESRSAALRGILAEKKVLIVLDDVRSAEKVRPLLPATLQCAILLTTRDLDTATALDAESYTLDEFSAEESYALLCKILGTERVLHEKKAAQTICTRLQHLPLAVEITAQRLVSRSHRRLADMAERLADVAERLDLAISDRAVRTSFMVSWESLDSNLQTLFTLLAVFEGRSFTAEAAATVAQLDLYTAEEALFSLVALSLLSETEQSEIGEIRYCQHTLLADFAKEQFYQKAGASTAQIEVAKYYQTFAQQHSNDYQALRPEWENLMAGIRLAHSLQQQQLVLAYAKALQTAWFARTKYMEARAAYPLIEEAAIALQNDRELAICLVKWGEVCLFQRDYDEAKLLLKRGMDVAQKIEANNLLAHIYYLLATVAMEKSAYTEAEHLLKKVSRMKEQRGNQSGVAKALYGRARILAHRGQYEEAEALCQQALTLQKQNSYPTNEGPYWENPINVAQSNAIKTLRLLSAIAYDQEKYKLARTYCEEAYSLSESLQDLGASATTLYRLSMICRRQKQLSLAQGYAEKSSAMFERMGDQKMQAAALYSLSLIKEDLQAYKTALTLGEQSLALSQKAQDNFGAIHILGHLGDLHQQMGREKQAQTVWQKALELTKSVPHPSTASLSHRLAKLGEMKGADFPFVYQPTEQVQQVGL